ncbi:MULTISPECIES: aminodeoxychorismate synthase component I [Mycolicibacterium]|uniref:Para-aminobenzoate synthase, subunit I n=1 Tax=Mycolicibacterium vanbaalenii (strain DSM 7251 / JCM 13017 / BCRC 16820 / KCTC 9966 / NRRL B-24157 / PYR-1) TaxID=350058 RepID=A1TEI0_MYCVP|nr:MULTISPECIES: aminodeoxychorismate synthase component I [Mycolicibacterium]ABM15580.1 para-aminobenzoate synthase, subunit I [Mycolicibacterium vanbaalenii PYR-1]MCV7130725.1 aminodeoxychorismate synthase component I [Mycolicibacterium vanbaalenii PYR-1]MDW5613310.1 aminodeoxychorismate synthase component I [Mycolicibacterium sp. D5.8-2]QZY45163.1 aminodeoxychorismate synthase component I [Mycolicibacterium austroafricanum]UJL28937.1 aminodeoxychorismate synthase component I [Mycolicibacter
MRIERLGDLGSAPTVLRTLAAAASASGIAPPAALLGDWFSSRAVIAPSLIAGEVAPRDAFAVTPGSRCDGPVGGGWFGYLSYPDGGADGLGPRIPQAAGGWADTVLRCDRDGVWWHESLSGAALPGWVTEAVQSVPDPRDAVVTWGEPDRHAHRRGVLACLEAIAAGEVYQACVCTQFAGVLAGAPVDFFAEAAARTVPARAAFVAGDWGAVASLSPELFLRRCGEAVTSSPIKGTLPDFADPATLRASVKDVAENIMIVDLVRNDLGRVARTGSVSVPELLAVRPAPGVWHLVSTVSARVPEDTPTAVLLDATFPPASVTGTPKSRARGLLTGWEPHRRGIYCGTVGLASPVAGCELNVAIRTVEFGADGSAVLGVGGGITADSDPDLEWEECLHKAAPIVNAVPVAVPVQPRARSTAS